MSIDVQHAERFLRNFRRQRKGENCRSVPSAERRRLNECFQAPAVPRVRNPLRPADPRAVPRGFPEDDSLAGGPPAKTAFLNYHEGCVTHTCVRKRRHFGMSRDSVHFGSTPEECNRPFSLRRLTIFKASSLLSNFPITILYQVQWGDTFRGIIFICFPFNAASFL
jgi:hypothetical protein